MPAKKKNRFTALAPTDFAEPVLRDTTKTAMGAAPDVAALAAVLAADYPLLDQPLIMAIMSDHESSSLLSKLPEIREQLGILEATLVPDSSDYRESFTSPSAHADEDELVQSTSSLGISSRNNGKSRSPLSRTSTTESIPLHTDSRESRSSETSPTSVTEDEGGEGFLDELELLRELFPTVPLKQVQEALSVEPSLPAAIDHLLSLELIKDVETRGEWPDEIITEKGEIKPVEDELLPPFMPALARISSHPPRKSRSKRNKQITVPLVDTLKRTSSQLPSPASSRGQSPSRKTPPSRSLDNAWGTMASLAAHLSDLLSPSAHYFLSYLHSPKYYSPYSAVRASLVAIPGLAAVKEDVRSRQVLQEMYGLSLGEGKLQTQNDLELCAKVAGGDVATVMDLMELLAEISQWAGDDDLDRYDQYSKSASNSPVSIAHAVLPPSPDVGTVSLSDASDAEDHVKRKSPKNPNLMTRRPKPRERNPEDDELYRTELMMRPGTKTTNLLKDRIIPGAKAAVSSSTNPTAHDNFGATSSFSTPMGRSKSHPGKQVHPLNWRHVNHIQERQRRNGQLHPYAANIPSYARGALPHDATPGALYSSVHSGDLTVEECLRRAQDERERRESSVRLAGKHFKLSGSKATNGSVAGTYAIRARESADAARVWELRAAEMVVMTRLEQTGHTIDLHNLTIMEAKEVVLQAAERWWEKEKAKAKFSGFPEGASSRQRTFVPGRGMTVITGVGRHSAGKMGVLGPAVANTLEANGWRVERGERSRGYLMVTGKHLARE